MNKGPEKPDVKTFVLLCRICGKAVAVEEAKTDSEGKAIHEECNAVKVQSENANKAGMDGEATTRSWNVIARKFPANKTGQKLSELIIELKRALDEQGIGKQALGQPKPEDK